MIARKDNRLKDQIREVEIIKNYIKYAEGSVLISQGNTKIICNATIENSIPRWLKGQNSGWITAEYSMLPRATGVRTQRDVGKTISGRTQEIQRLIGRSLRSAVNLEKIKDFTIKIDCDVIQADGGTRTASITGAMVALIDALKVLQKRKIFTELPIKSIIAAISTGIVNNQVLLDLDYSEDCKAATDFNIVMNERSEFIELQGSAEQKAFNKEQLDEILNLAQTGINQLINIQKHALGL